MEEEKRKDCKLEDLYILLDGDEDAVEIGDEALLEGQDVYADDLVSCIALLDTMEKMMDVPEGENVTFVFLNQFWSGRMGVRAAVQNVKPHTCILCGTSDALEEGDPQGEKPIDLQLGKGPAVRFRERIHAYDGPTCRALADAAHAAGVSWQGEARNSEFSGGIEVLVTGSRAGQCFLGIPVKDRGTVNPKYCQDDVNACVAVLEEFIKKHDGK